MQLSNKYKNITLSIFLPNFWFYFRRIKSYIIYGIWGIPLMTSYRIFFVLWRHMKWASTWNSNTSNSSRKHTCRSSEVLTRCSNSLRSWQDFVKLLWTKRTSDFASELLRDNFVSSRCVRDLFFDSPTNDSEANRLLSRSRYRTHSIWTFELFLWKL